MKGINIMKKSINVILAGILAVPMLALGISVVSPLAQTASAVECKTGKDATPEEAAACADPNHKPGKDSVTLFGPNGIVTMITKTMMVIIGSLSVIMIIYGGIRYTISGGESANITAAKNTILYAIVGLVVAIMAYAIVDFVLTRITA